MTTEYFRYSSGYNLYAKSSPLSNPWSGNVIDCVPNGNTGEYSVVVDSTKFYTVFIRSGGTYNSTDLAIAVISPQPGLTKEIVDQINARLSIPVANLPTYTGTVFSIFKGTNWNFNVSGIGDIADDFYFTMKSDSSLPDSQSELQINTSGVIYINGQYVGNQSGVLTYSSGNGGTINISVEPEITTLIGGGLKYEWDIKSIDPTEIRSFGKINIKEDITDLI